MVISKYILRMHWFSIFFASADFDIDFEYRGHEDTKLFSRQVCDTRNHMRIFNCCSLEHHLPSFVLEETGSC